MTWGDAIFPLSVLVIKFLFKLLAAKAVEPLDFMRALVGFPLDIAFLALSFGAAILFVTPVTKLGYSSGRTIAAFVTASLAASLIVAAICRFSDMSVTKEYWIRGIATAAINYTASLIMLAAAMNVGEYIK